MSSGRRQIKTKVDSNLVGQLSELQARVSMAGEPSNHDGTQQVAFDDSNGQGGGDSASGVGTPRRLVERATWRNVEHRKRVQRTTLSMPVAVGARARRLAMALTLLEERDVSLGTALSQALDLLEEKLRAHGARIPENAVELRTGKRHL